VVRPAGRAIQIDVNCRLLLAGVLFVAPILAQDVFAVSVSAAPGIGAAREAARRMQCVNNLKQIGITLHNDNGALGAFPSAGIIAPMTNYWVCCATGPNLPTSPGHYRCSSLVQIMPFTEQGNGFNAMNFNIPLYDVNGNDMPQNTTVYIVQIKEHLCPSDVRDHVLSDQAPSNYCVNTRDGLPGGFGLPASYGNPDGPIYLNSKTIFATIQDGKSNTSLFGESIIGSNSNIPRTNLFGDVVANETTLVI
jgi:hypothetical protein